MNTVEEYFDQVRRLVQNVPGAQAEQAKPNTDSL